MKCTAVMDIKRGPQRAANVHRGSGATYSAGRTEYHLLDAERYSGVESDFWRKIDLSAGPSCPEL